MTVTRKLLLSALILFATLLLVFLVLVINDANTDLNIQESNTLTHLQQSLLDSFESQKHLVLSLATQTAENPAVQAAFAAQDRQRLIDLLQRGYENLARQYGISQAQFHLPPAQSFLRLHQLDQFGDDLSSFRFTVLAANQQKQPISGLEIGPGGLGVRGVVPVVTEGQHSGTFEYGIEPSKADFESLKEQVGADWQILLSSVPAAIAAYQPISGTAQPPVSDLLLQFSTLAQPIFADPQSYQRALNGQTAVHHTGRDGKQYAILSAPLKGFSNQVIGVVDIILDRTQAVQTAVGRIALTSLLLVLLTLIIGIAAAYLIARTMRPVRELTETAQAVKAGDLSRAAPVRSQDEFGALAASFNQMTTQMRDLVGSLENRIETRTEQLRASADVGRTAVSVLNPNELLRNVVNLISDRFGFYYAAVFIIDDSGRYAVLREATGEAGQTLKEHGHQLEVTGQSMVGDAIMRRRPCIALDTGAAAVRFANPLLPDTRSEIALPLIVGDRVLGALDVQSTQGAAFDEASAAVLQSMADQIAIAWYNALAYAEMQAVARRARALFAASRVVGQLQANLVDTIHSTMHAAAAILEYNRWCVLTYNEIGTALVCVAAHSWPGLEEPLDVRTRLDHPLIFSAQEEQELFINDPGDGRLQHFAPIELSSLVSVPIKTRDRLVGVLAISRPPGSLLTDGDLDVGRSLASLVAVAIENHNLAETSQRTLRELDEINRSLTGQSWDKFIRRQEKRDVMWVSSSDVLRPQMQPEVSEALASGQIATRPLADGQQLGVAVPIKLRDLPVGALRLIMPQRTWNPEMAAALDSIAGHVAQASENARLIAETEERLSRERALADATEKVRQRSEVEAILQTAATELARYLNAAHIDVRFDPQSDQSSDNGQKN